MKFMIYGIISMLIMLLVMLIMNLNKFNQKQDKLNPFECGFNPNSKSRIPFSLHFFLIMCLFLIFDSEITLILPMLMSMNLNMTNSWMMTLIITISILFIGIIYEWNKKFLNWLM
uniref:NADH-ubiquinone oxidoreductase chain 3 n=2 Tax=Xenos TaxID=32435 RepID=A0A7T1WQ32_9NEOP|nr:NADH dehydrogenase subunit 3 [Xenos yangi]QPP04704.1 NADH dehydrogenase subunit 3 [Xenos cf. moutoni RZ-2020]UXG18681.1 NADH dehydrogenase subunit 3 [Xenos yangi]